MWIVHALVESAGKFFMCGIIHPEWKILGTRLETLCNQLKPKTIPLLDRFDHFVFTLYFPNTSFCVIFISRIARWI